MAKFVVGCQYKVINPKAIEDQSGIRFKDNQVFTCHGSDEVGCYSKEGLFNFEPMGMYNMAWDAKENLTLPNGWAVCGHELLDSGAVVLVN